MSSFELIVVPDADALASAANDRVVRAFAEARERGATFRLALAGGSTPRRLYERLAREQRVTWTDVEILFGDERVVGADHEKSNYRMARETLLDHVPIPDHQVHRIETERGAAEAARAYAAIVAERPLDLVLLGMGGDGHTASIFPGATDGRGVVVTESPEPPIARVSLALDVISRAKSALFLVAGEAKAERLAEVVAMWHAAEAGTAAPSEAAALPAAMVHSERVCWLVDEGAARLLPERKR